MIIRRIRYWLRNRDRARLLREEMHAHLSMRTEELMEQGMPEPDARAQANRQFGNITRLAEDSRSTWIARWITDLSQDSAYAIRTLRKQPGFTAAAVVSTSLGIGACSMIFGLANFALFRPLPVAGSATLLSISGKFLNNGQAGNTLAYPDYVDLKKARSLESVTAFFPLVAAVIAARSGVEPQRYWGSLTMANYFEVVQPQFVLGRGFDAARDDRRGEPPVIVLSHKLWQSRFGSDPDIVGRLIEFNNRKVAVAGVTGPGFRGTEVGLIADFWVPCSMLDALHLFTANKNPLDDRAGQWLMAAARLREGFSERQARAELDVLAARLAAAFPATNADRGFYAERAGQVNPGLRTLIVLFFVLLLAVSVLVLLTGCANVANLLLARGSARQQEIATRLAIGAGRGRVVRQLLTESLLLALLGGAGGFFLARYGTSSLARFHLPIALPVDFSVSLDYRVVIFSVVLSVLTGIVFGLIPALRATRSDLSGRLKNQPLWLGTIRFFSLRNALVIGQVTICMVLLVCSALFLRSLRATRLLDPGIRTRNLLLMNFDPTLSERTETSNTRLLQDVLERAASIPGVESASLTTSVPLSLLGVQGMLSSDSPAGGKKAEVNVDVYSVSRGFFDTLGVPLAAGEDFRPDVPAEGVAIINHAAAEQAFPNQNPVGRRARYDDQVVRIIGVVATTKSRTIAEDPRPCIYLPILRNFGESHPLGGVTLLLHTRGNPASFAAAGRHIIHSADPGLAVFDVRTFDEHMTNALLLPRAAAFLFGLAGFMGLLIATIGIYGVVSFTVARQTKEIGIRMALGARRSQVLATVLKQAVTLTVAGSGVGLVLALVLSRFIQSLLYGISPTDPLTFLAVPAFLILVSVAACLVPARRAATVDPICTLRYE